MACHLCENPMCLNPSHLAWGSSRDNQLSTAEVYQEMKEDMEIELGCCGAEADWPHK
jgi:hypothetical protein